MYQHIKIIDGLDIKMLIWTFHVNRQSNRCVRQWAQQIDLLFWSIRVWRKLVEVECACSRVRAPLRVRVSDGPV